MLGAVVYKLLYTVEDIGIMNISLTYANKYLSLPCVWDTNSAHTCTNNNIRTYMYIHVY